MTPQEIAFIDSNFLDLKRMVKWNVSFSTSLIQLGAIPSEDINDLAEISPSSERIRQLIEKLKSIEKGFAHLVKALELTGQSGATKILGKFTPDLNKPKEENKDITNASKRIKLDVTEPGPSKTKVAASISKVEKQSSELEDDEVKPDFVQEYLHNFFRKELRIVMAKPTPLAMDLRKEDPYKLSQYGKGLAFVASISDFDEKKRRPGGDMDRVYMLDIFKNLGFDIFPTCLANKTRWTKEELVNGIDDMKTKCDVENNHPNCIVIFISSHGLHDYIAVTDSKGKKKSTFVHVYKDIILKFYKKSKYAKSGCTHLDTVPKIFILNSCQNLDDLEDDDFNSEEVVASNAALDNAVIVTSQVTGLPSKRNKSHGSIFPHCLAYVLMKYSAEKSLQEMLEMVSQIVKHTIKQIPEIRGVGLQKLYFSLKQ